MNKKNYKVIPIKEATRILSLFKKFYIDSTDLNFKKKCLKRINCNVELIKENLINPKELYYIEEQKRKGEKRYKLVFELSGRYCLVVVFAPKLEEKTLKLITTIKPSRKLKKEWRLFLGRTK